MSSDGDNSQCSAGGFVMSEHPREASRNCRAVVNEDTGEVCGETEGLRILDQFRQIYEARMEKVEREEAAGIEADSITMKLTIMKEWIKDLGEQNVMLVRTVQDLEQAAGHRVKILEGKLKETAGIVSEKMSRLAKPNEDTVSILNKRICQLERDEIDLHQKIENLKCDIRGLLELIRRARCENCWNLQGITFYEIDPDQVLPEPTDCTCNEDVVDTESIDFLKRRIEVLSESEKKARKCQAELQDRIADLDNKLLSRETTMNKYILMLQSLRDTLKKRAVEKSERKSQERRLENDLESDIATIKEIVERAISKERNEDEDPEKSFNSEQTAKDVCDEIKELRAKLEEKSRRLSCVEKESLETQEVLTNEVAEKHQLCMKLRQELAELEDQRERANVLIQFKEEVIKGMRKDLKKNMSTMKKAAGPSGRRVRINADVVCCDDDEPSPKIPANSNGCNIVSDLTNVSASWKRQSEALLNLRGELREILEELHPKELEEYEGDLANAQVKIKNMETLLQNYKSEVIDRTEMRRETKCSDNGLTIHKLAKSIDNLSKVCVENSNIIVLLERALEQSQTDDRATQHETRVIQQLNERWKWDAFDRQFNAMEEFRVCTVEAQAATENLREEMEIVTENLKNRHQRYLDLSSAIKQMHSLVTRTKENVSRVIGHLEKQAEERISWSDKVACGEMKLKDLKNEINKARSERSRDVVDFAGQSKFPDPISLEMNTPEEMVEKVVEAVRQIVDHLRLLRSQDQCGTSLLGELNGQLCNVECSLRDLEKNMDSILMENETAQELFNEKILRMDKFERELDYTHTKMEEVLESILQSKQRMIDVGVCNICSCTPSDAAVPASEISSRNAECNKSFTTELEQLRNALRSKDKLLEDKDEMIRIQKDSITMTHVELKDQHQKMQAKIDAQNIAMGQHIEEKRLLLEQSKLQNQTIGHLQDALVEAKRCMATQQQPQQKNTIDLTVSEVWSPITPTMFNSSDVHDV